MSRSRLPILLAGLLIVSSFNQAAYSQQSTSSNDHLWKPKTRSVSVFKNGFAFFTQSGKVKLNDGWCYASELPPAAFGTLAVYSTKTNQVVDIVGSGNGEVVDFETTHTTIDNAAKIKTLSAWTGFRIRLETVNCLKLSATMQFSKRSANVRREN
jgi:hypothetical protein